MLGYLLGDHEDLSPVGADNRLEASSLRGGLFGVEEGCFQPESLVGLESREVAGVVGLLRRRVGVVGELEVDGDLEELLEGD